MLSGDDQYLIVKYLLFLPSCFGVRNNVHLGENAAVILVTLVETLLK